MGVEGEMEEKDPCTVNTERDPSSQPANSKDTSNNMNTSNNRNASNSVEAGNCRFFLDLATCQHHQERQQQQECQKQQ